MSFVIFASPLYRRILLLNPLVLTCYVSLMTIFLLSLSLSLPLYLSLSHSARFALFSSFTLMPRTVARCVLATASSPIPHWVWCVGLSGFPQFTKQCYAPVVGHSMINHLTPGFVQAVGCNCGVSHCRCESHLRRFCFLLFAIISSSPCLF